MNPDYDKSALLDVITDATDDYTSDPGGYKEWVEALVAWEIDKGEHLDDTKLAYNLALFASVANWLPGELPGFEIRALDAPAFAYHDACGELQAGHLNFRKLHTLSDDPRELACAIAAEVKLDARKGENVVIFRRLVYKTPLPRTLHADGTRSFNPFSTQFGVAKVG
jgi:hypothetical protein